MAFCAPRALSEAFLAAPEKVAPIDDLRRPDSERESWAPPKIKKREAEYLGKVGGEGNQVEKRRHGHLDEYSDGVAEPPAAPTEGLP